MVFHKKDAAFYKACLFVAFFLFSPLKKINYSLTEKKHLSFFYKKPERPPSIFKSAKKTENYSEATTT